MSDSENEWSRRWNAHVNRSLNQFSVYSDLTNQCSGRYGDRIAEWVLVIEVQSSAVNDAVTLMLSAVATNHMHLARSHTSCKQSASIYLHQLAANNIRRVLITRMR